MESFSNGDNGIRISLSTMDLLMRSACLVVPSSIYAMVAYCVVPTRTKFRAHQNYEAFKINCVIIVNAHVKAIS